jgi:hypothetical protein
VTAGNINNKCPHVAIVLEEAAKRAKKSVKKGKTGTVKHLKFITKALVNCPEAKVVHTRLVLVVKRAKSNPKFAKRITKSLAKLHKRRRVAKRTFARKVAKAVRRALKAIRRALKSGSRKLLRKAKRAARKATKAAKRAVKALKKRLARLAKKSGKAAKKLARKIKKALKKAKKALRKAKAAVKRVVKRLAARKAVKGTRRGKKARKSSKIVKKAKKLARKLLKKGVSSKKVLKKVLKAARKAAKASKKALKKVLKKVKKALRKVLKVSIKGGRHGLPPRAHRYFLKGGSNSTWWKSYITWMRWRPVEFNFEKPIIYWRRLYSVYRPRRCAPFKATTFRQLIKAAAKKH